MASINRFTRLGKTFIFYPSRLEVVMNILVMNNEVFHVIFGSVLWRGVILCSKGDHPPPTATTISS